GGERALVEVVPGIDVRPERRLADPARAVAARLAAVAQPRGKLGARAGQRAEELVDPRGGGLGGEGLAPRGADPRVEPRVVELLPPQRVRRVGGGRIVHAPLRRRVELGALVVRADRAAGEKNRQEHDFFHAFFFPSDSSIQKNSGTKKIAIRVENSMP